MSLLPNSSLRIAMCYQMLIFSLSLLLPIGGLQAQNVGINTETPEAGLHVVSDNGMILTGTYGLGLAPQGGYATKMVWNSKTGSFRLGRITDADGGIYENWWAGFYTGDYSIASGVNCKANGYASSAFGQKVQALGISSFVAGGTNNIASGNWSFTTGFENEARSFAEFVIGANATLDTTYNISAFDLTDRLFVIGNGQNNSNRHNALTVLKNGKTGIGTDAPEEQLHILGNAILDQGRLQFNNTGGSVFIGQLAGENDDWSDNHNVFIGQEAGKSNVEGTTNIAIGSYALDEATNTYYNIAIGQSALGNGSMSGNLNLSIGNFSMGNNTSGQDNIALGQNTLGQNQTGWRNVAIGNYAMDANITGLQNTSIGTESLGSSILGNYNTAIGFEALYLSNNHRNTALGMKAGYNAQGSGSVFLGYNAGLLETGSNKLYISNSSTTAPLIYGDFLNKKLIINDSLQSKYFKMTNGATNGNVLVSDAAGHGTWTEPSAIFTEKWNSNGDHIYNANAMNVGIGESNPTEQLHVNGNMRLHAGRLKISGTGQSVFIGQDAGLADDLTDNNVVFIGHSAGKSNVNGANNIAIGSYALDEAANTYYNIAIGESALGDGSMSGNFNLSIGNFSLGTNTSGENNIALGQSTLGQNQTGLKNVAIGNYAMDANITGAYNTSIGTESLGSSIGGDYNTAIGFEALYLSNSHKNTALGYKAGYSAQDSGSVFLGYNAGLLETGSNKLYISNSSTIAPLIYGDFSNNKVIIHDSLQSTYFKMTNGANNGFVLVSDAAGHGTWTTPSEVIPEKWNSNGEHIYNTNSMNVGIGVSDPTEQLHVNGNMRLHAGRLKITGTGRSVFIGEDAGLADDLSENNSVFIGYEAGKANVDGTNNIAIGSLALDAAANSNYNIAIGESALGHTDMSGNLNLSIGNFSLENNTIGSDNIALGQNTLGQNQTGWRNVVVGNYAMDANTTGAFNTSIGTESLAHSVVGDFNTAIGFEALYHSISHNNTAIGIQAGYNALGSDNVFVGYNAGLFETGSNTLYISNTGTTTPLIYGDFSQKKLIIHDSLQTKYLSITDGAAAGKVLQSNASGRGSWVEPNSLFEDIDNVNIFLGQGVGQSVTSATDNTIIGSFAGEDLSTGYENTGYGKWALANNTTANFNTAIGHNTLNVNTTGENNTALGWSALSGATGSSNVALGAAAGSENTSGSQNIFLGTESGMNNTGSGNVFIGHNAGKNLSGSNKLNIDNSDTATPLIQGDFTTNEVTINDSLTVGKELGVGTATPASTFEVNGSVAAKFKTPLVAGTTHPDGSGMVWRYNSGTGTITLPGASTCPNRMYVIINQTGTSRTISTYRDLTTTNQTTLGSSVALWVMSDGTEWWQIK